MAVQLCFVFFITFFIYPGISYKTKFTFLESNQSATAWLVIILSVLYSVFDTIGRYCAEHFRVFSKERIIFLTLSRLVFVATFILVAVTDKPAWLIGADWFKIVNMILFSFTNGYWGTSLMVYGPNCVHHAGKEKAGMIMSIHLIGGVFLGSLLATDLFL